MYVCLNKCLCEMRFCVQWYTSEKYVHTLLLNICTSKETSSE